MLRLVVKVQLRCVILKRFRNPLLTLLRLNFEIFLCYRKTEHGPQQCTQLNIIKGHFEMQISMIKQTKMKSSFGLRIVRGLACQSET